MPVTQSIPRANPQVYSFITTSSTTAAAATTTTTTTTTITLISVVLIVDVTILGRSFKLTAKPEATGLNPKPYDKLEPPEREKPLRKL